MFLKKYSKKYRFYLSEERKSERNEKVVKNYLIYEFFFVII